MRISRLIRPIFPCRRGSAATSTATSPWRCRPWRRGGPPYGAARRARCLTSRAAGARGWGAGGARRPGGDTAGVDTDWPRRVAVRDVTLQGPWVLLERDQGGALTLRALLSPRAPDGSRPRGSTPSASAPVRPLPASSGGSTIPITVDHLVVADGGARTVDHGVAPPIALDMQRLSGRIDGLSTDPRGNPARLHMTGRVGADSDLALRGTVGSLGGPLRLDMNAELRGFAVPRTNPYLVQQVGWEARGGRRDTRRGPRRGAGAHRTAPRHDRRADEGSPRRYPAVAAGGGTAERSTVRYERGSLEHGAERGRQGDHGAGELDRPRPGRVGFADPAGGDRPHPIRAGLGHAGGGSPGASGQVGGFSRGRAR